ncbi:hypothetical protein GCM10023075_58540 [Streptosporangium album]
MSPAHATATGHAGCPTPTKAEVERSNASASDQPPRGVTAIKGVRVNHIPKGFSQGQTVINRHNGISEYGYQWVDNRDDVDRKHRALWVRVVCWPNVQKLSQLRNAPFDLGRFSGDVRTAKIGGRETLTQQGDGALGHGQYVGWVERKGTVVTVMASQPLVPELSKIIKGIQLP